MAQIYKKSRTTLVWLGEAEDGNADEVYNFIFDVSKMIRSQLLEHNGLWNKIPFLSLQDTIVWDPRWESLRKMAHCAWFSRVWVVQEAGLSTRPQILYGNRNIDWDSCFTVLHWLRHRGYLISYNFRIEWSGIHMDKRNVWAKLNNYMEYGEGAQSGCIETPVIPWTLLDVLHSSRCLSATDPKDHIYAFLGHHSASHSVTGKLIVSPDYTTNVEQVYSDLATNWIEWTQDLNILSFVTGARNIRLPSWVPLWNEYNGNVLAQLGELIFNAGGQRQASVLLVNEGKCLKVRSVIFDKVQCRSTYFEEKDFRWTSPSGDEESNVSKILKWTKTLSYVLDASSPCAYSDDRRLTACAATLTAGMFSRTLSEFESHAAAFLLFFLLKIEPAISPAYIEAMESKAAGGDPKLGAIEITRPLVSRRFIITRAGRYGLAPVKARKGDSCCVLFGAKTPFIVRPVADSPDIYQLIGEAYVHGMMKGEVLEMCAQGKFQEENIILA
jgi:hypothetical protein